MRFRLAVATFAWALLAMQVRAEPSPEEIGRAGATPGEPDRYSLAVLRDGKDLLVYRLDTLTGRTWSVLDTAIVPVKEKESIPKSSYELAVISTKDGRGHWAVRIDRRTGRMWYATENQWLPYQENP